MKKNKFTRIIALALASVSALSLFGCKPKEEAAPAKSKPTNVWRETALTVPASLQNAYNLKYAAGKIYFPGNEWEENTQAQTSTINVYDPEAGTVTVLLSIVAPPQDKEKPIYENHSFGNLLPLSDGTFWVSEDRSKEDYTDPENTISEHNVYLKHYDTAANELSSIDAAALLGGDEQYFYINGIETDAAGNLYILTNSLLYVLDGATGEIMFKLTQENGSIQSLVRFGDGSVAASMWDNATGTNPFKRVNVAAKAWGDEVPVPANTWFDMTVPGDENYLFFYIKYNVGVYGLKADGTSEEVINFLNSDLSSENIRGLQYTDDGTFFLAWYDYDEASQAQILKFSELTRVPDSEIKEAVILTYGTLYLDWDLKRKVLKFNKDNKNKPDGEESYRIVINDYSVYNNENDWQAGYKQLTLDVIAGKMPEIINLENINAQSFINKGMLADLYELMDASPNVNREDYVTSVLEASEVDGKLYRFMPSFNIYTVAAKKSIVGDTPGWTMDDLNALLAKYPDAKSFYPMTKTEILNYALMLGMSQFVDWGAGTVNFGENFIKLLEYANTFPKEIDYNKIYGENGENYEDMQNAYREDRVLLNAQWVSGYRTIRDVEDGSFYDDVTFIGFPSDDKLGSVFMPTMQFAISSKSSKAVQQVCFDFLSTLVETEPNFANAGGYFWSNFSINKNYNDKVREFELTPLRERPGYVNYGSGGGVDVGPLPIPRPALTAADSRYLPNNPNATQEEQDARYALTQEEVDAVDHLIANTSKFYVNDEEMNIIISEETDAYFAGQKSAEETARLIQSRVQLYVSESR